MKAQSQTQKEKFPRDRQKARPPCKAPRVEEGDCQLPLQKLGSQNGKLSQDHPGLSQEGQGSSLQAAVLVSELSGERCLQTRHRVGTDAQHTLVLILSL